MRASVFSLVSSLLIGGQVGTNAQSFTAKITTCSDKSFYFDTTQFKCLKCPIENMVGTNDDR